MEENVVALARAIAFEVVAIGRHVAEKLARALAQRWHVSFRRG